jgi:hypothetical protein
LTKPSSTHEPTIPEEVSRLDGPRGFLARASPADGKLFSLTGRRGTAWGTGLRGIEELRVADWIVRDLLTGLGPASNVLVDPASVRRELVAKDGTALETLLLAQRVPVAILQWSRPVGRSDALELELSCTLTCDLPGELTPDASGDRLTVTLRPTHSVTGSRTAIIFARPTPERWEVRREGSALVVRVHLRVTSDAALSVMLAAADSPTEHAANVRVMSNPRTEEVRVDQSMATSRAERLALHTGVAELDEGLEWAKARLRGAVAEETNGRRMRRGGAGCAPAPEWSASSPTSPFTPEAEACWIALGALASGEPEPAEVVLEGDITSAYHILLAARYVAWTGSEQRLFEHAGRLDAGVASGAAHGAPDAAIRIALRELADAWESVGDRKRAADIRAHVPSADARTHGRRLPLLGEASEDPREEDLVEAMLTNEARTSFRAPGWEPGGGLERGLRAWALLRSGDPELGYSLLREHLASGFRGGFGMWSEAADVEPNGVEPAACADHTASAALVPCALLFGLLGAVADAPLARMRLAPRLPAAWKSFEVTGIRAGDASLSLRYERENQRHTFRIRQDDGRIPIMLVFEPEVPAARIDDALVDGPAADLTRTSRRGRSGVRVQLPLASERVITLIGERGP